MKERVELDIVEKMRDGFIEDCLEINDSDEIARGSMKEHVETDEVDGICCEDILETSDAFALRGVGVPGEEG